MKATLLAFALLSGCATNPEVLLPAATEHVPVNPILLASCTPPKKIINNDVLGAASQWFSSMKECSDKQKALSDIIKQAFNIDSK